MWFGGAVGLHLVLVDLIPVEELNKKEWKGSLKERGLRGCTTLARPIDTKEFWSKDREGEPSGELCLPRLPDQERALGDETRDESTGRVLR